MNFFGHAAVARWRSSDPAFVLGAMLPDFCAMAGARLAAVTEPAIAEGVRTHHETDSVFHCAPTFVAHCAAGVAALSAAGVRRGSARAAAHVGTELLLDGFVVREDGLSDLYRAALRVAGLDAHGPELRFASAAEAGRFHQLIRRLVSWGVPPGLGAPERVAERLVAALARRPRLALTPAEDRAVGVWLERAWPTVGSNLDELVMEVRQGLEARSWGGPLSSDGGMETAAHRPVS